ncbi:MAG: phosphatase PAP2 family protein [Phycisphaerales bacterium]|nr:phosphatase PAP2 family protein [Phycisphaerales bacterium]
MKPDASPSLRLNPLAAPLLATVVLSLLLLTDAALVRWHASINWPWRLSDLEHLGSAWCNRVVPYAALLVGLAFNRRAMRQLIFALPLQAIIAHLLKWIIGRVRPTHGDSSLLFSPFSLVHGAIPSGHATLVWTVAFVFACQKSRSTALWIVVALFVCWARLQTYAHFPSDLFAGAMIGWMVALLTGQALAKWIETGEFASLRARPSMHWRELILWWMALAAPIGVAVALGERPVSSEPAAARDHVAAFYRDYLGREPDEPGLAAYTRQRLDGLPLLSIARDFLDSDEFRKRLRDLEPPQRVALLYELLLHREPSPQEIARDAPLVEDLSRQRSRLPLLIMRLTWNYAAPREP